MFNKESLLSAKDNLSTLENVTRVGKVKTIKGPIVQVVGLDVFINEVCIIKRADGVEIKGEVIGFEDNIISVMTYEDLSLVGPNSEVYATGRELEIKVSDSLIGKVLNGVGEPISGKKINDGKFVPINGKPPHPLSRPIIKDVMVTGVKAVDSLITIGVGQRIGIFAGSGVGKSTLIGMMVRNTDADINVVCLIGERGREVNEFLERDLGPEGMKKSVVIVATSDEPSLIRIKSSFVATTIAEYFRDQGKSVNLFMDSVTRLALAQRELGLSLGEPPTTKGFTPSVFSVLPKLLERSGTSSNGSITAFYTVLVEGDDMNEPVVDTVRGILDGHISLKRYLAEQNHYPAIDIGASVSRLFTTIASEQHKYAAGRFREIFSTYLKNEDLISIGAYKKGSNPEIDYAIEKYPEMITFLKQNMFENFEFDETVKLLSQF